MFLITERLINLREHAGFTQTRVAGLLKISRSAYSNYENNNRVPSLEILESISKLYDVPMSYLLGDDSILYDNHTGQYRASNSSRSTLSGDEILLLDAFRALNEEKKQELFQIIKRLNEN